VVFAGQLTGQIFAQFVVTALIVGLPIFLELFVTFHCETFLFGYHNQETIPLNIAANPYAFMVQLLAYNWIYSGVFTVKEFVYLGAILAFIALLITVSLILYKRRKLEMAGEFLAVRGMRPVFRYGAAFLAAFLFEGIAMGIFRHDKTGMVAFGLIGGALGFIIAEMLIRRTVRVFRHIKGAAVFSVCFILFILALQFDVTGYGRYTPPNDKVESIYLSNTWESRWFGRTEDWVVEPVPYLFTDEADIAVALELQRAIVEERPERPQHPSDISRIQWRYETYHMEVTLKNGRTVTRRYQFYMRNYSPIAALTRALDEAAKPQMVERLRNIGNEAFSINLEWYYSQDIEDLMEEYYGSNRVSFYRFGERLIKHDIPRHEIPGFLEALALDNQENPRWQSWQGNVLIMAYAARGMRDYRDERAIPIHIYTDDDNALNWLRENGYWG
jgi:hypothetical protein